MTLEQAWSSLGLKTTFSIHPIHNQSHSLSPGAWPMTWGWPPPSWPCWATPQTLQGRTRTHHMPIPELEVCWEGLSVPESYPLKAIKLFTVLGDGAQGMVRWPRLTPGEKQEATSTLQPTKPETRVWSKAGRMLEGA